MVHPVVSRFMGFLLVTSAVSCFIGFLLLHPVVTSVTSPLARPVLCFWFLSAAGFLTLYTTSLTLVFLLPGDWFLMPSFVLASPMMSPEAVCTVNGVKFSNMFSPLFLRFRSQIAGSATFTRTWLDLFCSSRGFTHLFTIMDRTSCWPEAIPLS